LVHSIDLLSAPLAEKVLALHGSGLRVLLCPPHPEEADLITSEHVQKLLTFLCGMYDFVVVDCGANYDDRTLTILERANDVLLIITPEIGPLKNAALFLALADKLGLQRAKIQIVLNRANSQVGIEEKDIQNMLHQKVAFRISSGGRVAVMSVNRGNPLVLEKPDHPYALQIFSIADAFVKSGQTQPAPNGTRLVTA
jgi:pilus assembly protein CpaE